MLLLSIMINFSCISCSFQQKTKISRICYHFDLRNLPSFTTLGTLFQYSAVMLKLATETAKCVWNRNSVHVRAHRANANKSLSLPQFFDANANFFEHTTPGRAVLNVEPCGPRNNWTFIWYGKVETVCKEVEWKENNRNILLEVKQKRRKQKKVLQLDKK
jgi:hypothetical protein